MYIYNREGLGGGLGGREGMGRGDRGSGGEAKDGEKRLHAVEKQVFGLFWI